jgi:rhodanese-related sulfurtransferase
MADHSRAHRWLTAVAAVLGALALAAGEPSTAHRNAVDDVTSVTAIDVARWLRDPRPALRVLDVRSRSDFDAYHVPGAEHAPLAQLSHREWTRESIVVLYAEDDARAARAGRLLRARGADTVHVLRGGLRGWIEQIAEPRLAALPSSATPAEQRERRTQLDLSRYFGGTPLVVPSATLHSARRPPLAAPGRQAEAAAVARIIRRGC